MGIRDSLNQQNGKLIAAISCLAIVAAMFLIFRPGSDGGNKSGDDVPLAFFSTDDGKTWFSDDARKIPPLNKDGKDAYGAYVYKCPDGKEFVAFLERYTPDAKRKREALLASGEQNAAPILDASKGIEIKVPGQTTWVKQSDPRAAAIMTVKCADGGFATTVLP